MAKKLYHKVTVKKRPVLLEKISKESLQEEIFIDLKRFTFNSACKRSKSIRYHGIQLD